MFQLIEIDNLDMDQKYTYFGIFYMDNKLRLNLLFEIELFLMLN